MVFGVKFDYGQYDKFRNWCVAVPVCRAMKTVCVVSKWPSSVRWRDQLLHNESGPSVEFRDGFRLWTISGTQVNEQIVMRPETQTIQEIESEGNEEVRRIRIERYGWPKYLAQSGAEPIDSRTNDVDGTRESLLRLKNGSLRLLCACRSTARVYAVGVPREIETCEQAQKWMVGGSSLTVNKVGSCLGAS